MNKLKKLIIPLIIMTVLIIGLIVFVIVKNNSGSEEEEVNYNVMTLSVDQLDKLTVVRKNKSDLVIDVDLDDSTNVLSYKYISEDSDPSVQYSDSALSSYLGMMCSFYANGFVVKNGNLAEYGLDDPEYKIVYTLRDGSSKAILIGHDTYDSVSCYFMVEGSDSVYTVTTVKKAYADYTAINFLQAQLLDIDYTQVNTVEFDRTYDNLNLVASCNTAEASSESGTTFYFVKPFKIKAGTHFASLMNQIFHLEISSYVEIADADKAMYGLDKPQYHFLISKLNGERVEIYLSALRGEYYYGYSNLSDKYFVISNMQLTYIDNSVTSLIDEFIAYYYADEISSVTGEYNGTSFRFDLDVPKDSRIADDNTTVKLDNRNAKIFNSEGRSYCAILFESLATIKIGGIDTEAKPAYTPEMNLTFNTKSYVTYKIDFVKRDDSSYYVFIDGEYSNFYVDKAELFANGGKDTYSYGAWAAYQLLDTAIKDNVGGIYDIPDNA